MTDTSEETSTIAITGSRFFESYKKQKIRQEQQDDKEDAGKSPLGNASDPVMLLDDDSSSSSTDNQESEQKQKTLLPAPSSKRANTSTCPTEKNKLVAVADSMDNNDSSSPTNKRKSISTSEKDILNAPVGSTTDKTNTNPFACFAYKPRSNANAGEIPKNSNPPLKWRLSTTNQQGKKVPPKNKGKESIKAISDIKKQQKKETFVSISDLSKKEQTRIMRKWHSMVDETAPLEVKRFQLLVAARLHARCQEVTVRKAMKSLQHHFSNEDKGFTVQTMAKSDPEVLASCITNLQFYNSKAEQIVKAANEILSKFNGIVPEDEKSLLQITGVGKVFADLLAFVNTGKAHEEEST